MNQVDRKNVQWFVVQTKPASETRAEHNLQNQGIETFLPQYEAYQLCGGKLQRCIKPLFPSYLFSRFDLDLHYYQVKWTRGVNKILGNGIHPIPVSDHVVETIKNRIGKDNLVILDDEWKEGDPVRILSGPFKDLRGVFQRVMSEKGRVRILLNLIGVDIPVTIPKWQLQRIA